MSPHADTPPQPPSHDDPYRSVVVDMSGSREADIIRAALARAAAFLLEDPADLYVAEVSNIRVVQRSRYRPHLGVEPKPIRWAATVKIRLRPEIVKARRGEPDPPEPPTKGGLRLASRGGETLDE